MPKEKITHLLSDLHEKFATDETSPEQELMLAQMKSQLEEWEGPLPADGDLLETVEMLLENIEANHPKASLIAKDIIEALKQLF